MSENRAFDLDQVVTLIFLTGFLNAKTESPVGLIMEEIENCMNAVVDP